MKNLFKLLLCMMPLTAMAWQPTQPIEATVAFTPGSANEILLRITAEEVTKNTGAVFNIRNRPGASGVVGTEQFSKTTPDGHSMIVFSLPGLAGVDKIAVPVGPGHTYTVDSFVYPTNLASASFAIIAHPSDKIATPKEFVESLKNEKVNISAGAGSRLVYEELQSRLHFKQGPDGVMRIEHKGPIDQLLDVAAGNVRFGIVPINVAAEFYKDKKIKVVALTSNRKIEQFPELPLMSSALPGFDISGNWGIALPAGTPADVVDWYTREFVKALRTPSVQALLKSQLFHENPELQTSAKFTQYMQARDREWQPLIDAALKTRQ